MLAAGAFEKNIETFLHQLNVSEARFANERRKKPR